MVAPHSLSDIERAKQAARVRALAARALCDPAWGVRLAGHVLAESPPPVGATVAGFWPMRGEIDPRPLLESLHARGHVVLLPETPPRGQPLIFRRWWPGMTMLAGRFGTFVPMGAPPGAPAGEVCDPDVLFIPLVAFDRAGRRLGYGGGYYDRTLARLPGAIAIGCAFAAQELDEVPAADYDARLHAVATERGVIHCKAR